MARLIQPIEKANDLLAHLGERLKDPFLLLVRLNWGWQFFLTGRGKLMNLERTTAFFSDLGLPMPGVNALLAGCTECFGHFAVV